MKLLNSFISTFKGFAKSVSYLTLRFSKLGTTFKKYLLHVIAISEGI